MENHLLIDLLRHGEPLGGVRYRGRSDDPAKPPRLATNGDNE